MQARFCHVNLIARDWKKLAEFYQQVFGCTAVPPERHIEEPWLQDSTGVPGAQLRGMHLRLPGYGANGPTIEIFEYQPMLERTASAPNQPGLGHLAFAVQDVHAAQAAVLDAGGSAVGEIVSVEIAGAGALTFAYVTDPEGNIVEIQRWADQSANSGSKP